jgi:hypothetical protein
MVDATFIIVISLFGLALLSSLVPIYYDIVDALRPAEHDNREEIRRQVMTATLALELTPASARTDSRSNYFKDLPSATPTVDTPPNLCFLHASS